MNLTMSTEFLTHCFHPGETLAILLRREDPGKIAQRVIKLEQATAPTYMRWLAHENASGMNVYVAANPLRSGSRKRTKECIAEVRHLYVDIDSDGDARVAAIRRSILVPEPTAIVSTSPGRYQVLWRVRGFNFSAQETLLRRLTVAFGGDPACTDCNRVIRVPGFQNTKYSPAYPVSVAYGESSVSGPDSFRLGNESEIAPPIARPPARSTGDWKHTPSEEDWSWVLSELSGGKDAALLTKSLALRRADKSNALYYAQRTVDMASARLALLSGASISDVIACLEGRRLSELPVSVCSARAREIAHTAAQMIARHKLA